MNWKEALVKLFDFFKIDGYPHFQGAKSVAVLANAYDFGEQYGFDFLPNDGKTYCGNVTYLVNKETGKVSFYLIQNDFKKWDSRKDIDISELPPNLRAGNHGQTEQ